MSKKKKQTSSDAGTYALCVTAGVIVGLGLGPLMGNFLATMAVGAIAGTAIAFLINKKSRGPTHKHPH